MRSLVSLSIILLLCCVVSACHCQKALTSETTSTDSIKVVYQERIVYVPDTVFVDIPHQTSEVVTPDSTSRIENDFAISMAWFANGLLHHSLEIKPQTLPVPFLKPLTTVTSSSEHKEQSHEKEIVTEYIERELTWWQKTCIYGFYGLTALIVLLYTIKRFRTHIERISKKLLNFVLSGGKKE